MLTKWPAGHVTVTTVSNPAVIWLVLVDPVRRFQTLMSNQLARSRYANSTQGSQLEMTENDEDEGCKLLIN